MNLSNAYSDDVSSICQEFVILMKKRTADDDGTDDIEAAFKVFDTKNDGFIDIDELMGVMVMLGNPRSEDEVKIMIAEEDKNGDGVIDREEFFSMLEKKKDIEA